MKTSLMVKILAGVTSILVRKKGRLAAACALVLIPFTGCVSPEEKAMSGAMLAAMDQVQKGCAANNDPENKETSIFCGQVQNGIGVAIIVGKPAWSEIPVKALLYWCLDGQVYVVNEVAQNCSPGLPPSPPEISVNSILDEVFY
jgi:hypothetical protein